MLKTLIDAFALISTWEVIIAMFAASVYGLSLIHISEPTRPY